MSMERSYQRVLLYDANNNPIATTDDGGAYKVETIAKARNSSGTIIDPATEGKQDDAITKLTSLDGKDFATETTQATLATETTADAIRDNVGEAIASPAANTLLDRLKSIWTSLNDINLVSGIKKIVDALPTGDNWIGKSKVGDGTNTVNLVLDNTIYRIESRASIVGQTEGAGSEKKVSVIDDISDSSVKRLQSESLLAPGSTVNIGSTIPSDPANLVIEFLSNATYDEDMLQDGTTPIQFTYAPAAGKVIAVQDVLVCFTADDFEFNGASFGPNTMLSNGCLFQIYTGGSLIDLYTIYQNEDFLRIPGRIPVINNTGPKDLLSAAFVFGGLIQLDGDAGDYVRFTVRDDLTSTKFKYFTSTIYGAEI